MKKSSIFSRGQKDSSEQSRPRQYKRGKLTQEQMEELMKLRAYDLYCKRDPNQGSAMNDWLCAEEEVKKELGLLA